MSSATSPISAWRALLILGGLGLADFFGCLIAARLRLLKFLNESAAALIDRHQPLGLRLEPTPRQPAIKCLRVVADPLDVVHRLLGRVRGSASGRSRFLFHRAHRVDRAFVQDQQRQRERHLAQHVGRREHSGNDEADDDEVAPSSP